MEDWHAFEEVYLQFRTSYTGEMVTVLETLPPVIRERHARYGQCSFGNFLFTLDPLEW